MIFQNWMNKIDKTNQEWEIWGNDKNLLDLLKNYVNFYNLITNFKVKD